MNKKILISTLFICIATFSFAQGFSMGTKGSLRNTWLLSKSSSQIAYSPTLGANFGGFATWYMVDTRSTLKRVLGIEIEYLYSYTFQNYKIQTQKNGVKETRNKIISYDLPVLLRFKPSFTQNRYFEAGINFGSIKEAIYKDTLGNSYEKTNTFLTNNISFVLGGGSDIKLAENIYLTLGLRAQIGIADIGGVDGLGRNVGDQTIFKNANSTTTFDYGFLTGIHYLIYKK